MKNDLYPELTEEGKKEAQELMNKFEKELKERAQEIISKFTADIYSDVLCHIESDHWQNYRSSILNAICDYGNKK